MPEETSQLDDVQLKVSDEESPTVTLREVQSNVGTMHDVDITDDFEVLDFIGRGGTGQVYKVREKNLDRVLAVKVLRKDLIVDNQTVKRFVHEAEAAANLSHPNVVSVYGHGETKEGAPYITMNFIDGENLAQTLKRERALSWQKTIELFLQLCDGLEHAHQQGLVHRDLKPSNVLVSTTDGIDLAHIVDFGIAKVVATRGDTLSTLTVSGEFLGTPMYMSPEQCLGQNVDKRTDIYALGCMMYEALNGAGPFAGASSVEIIAKKMAEESPRLSVKGIPPALSMIVSCCMARQASDRYTDVASLRADLQALLTDKIPKNAQLKTGMDKGTAWKRFFAFLLDYAIITTVTTIVNIFTLILIGVLAAAAKDASPLKDSLLVMMGIAHFAVPAVLTVLYYIGFEKLRGATLGKQVCGLTLTDAMGEKLTWKASFMRNTVKFIITIALPLSGLMGFALPQHAWGMLTTFATLALSVLIIVRSLITQRRLPWDILVGAQLRRR